MTNAAVISTPEWRYRDLLFILGSAKDIQRLLLEAGYMPPPEDTIQGWKTRNSIPGRWVPVIVQMGIDREFIRDLRDLKPKAKYKPREKKNDRRSTQGSGKV